MCETFSRFLRGPALDLRPQRRHPAPHPAIASRPALTTATLILPQLQRRHGKNRSTMA